MRRSGHHLTGLAAGLLVAPPWSSDPAFTAITVLGGWLGGVAPDLIEIPIGARRVIPHRRITHWMLAWALALGWALSANLHSTPLQALLLGFAAGGLMHCLVDFPNPMGVPMFHPWKRSSLNWWASGKYDLFISIALLGSGALAQHLKQ